MKLKILYYTLFAGGFAFISVFVFVSFCFLEKTKQQHFDDGNVRSEILLPVVIVPHHDVVKKKRMEFFSKIYDDYKNPETIILASTNHFGGGTKSVITTDYVWNLKGGKEKVFPDVSIVSSILENSYAENDKNAVRNDHGITNLVGEIHDFFPDAKIVPILFREDFDMSDLYELIDKIEKKCAGHCGLVASVDLSHYQSNGAAEIHDAVTIRSLETLDERNALFAEVDSNIVVSFLIRWAKRHSLSKFNVFSHTSSDSNGENKSGTTTHIMGYYEPGHAEKSIFGTTFAFAGGIGGGSCVSCFKKFLLSDFGSRALWGTDISGAFFLGDEKYINRNLYEKMIKNWKWKESFLKDYYGFNDDLRIFRTKTGEQKVAFIFAFSNNNLLEENIAREKRDGNFVIVLPKWIGEYNFENTEEQREKVDSWISSGADVIFGYHEGGIQNADLINGVPVFYSLGEFVGAQGKKEGLVLNGIVEKDNLRVVIDPIVSEGFGVERLTGVGRREKLQRVCGGIFGCDEGILILQRSL